MSQKILVIDDSPAATRLTENVLSQNFSNCDLLLAQAGGEGFDRLQVSQPDLIILNDTLPDMDGEAVCRRLLGDPLTASVPVVVISSNGHGKIFKEKYSNVVNVLSKPVTPESLLLAMNAALSVGKPQAHPGSALFTRDVSKIVFAGHTGFFSLRSALQMAYSDQLNGVLRLFVHRSPIELYMARGRFVFATSHNAQLYCKDSPVILSSTNLGLIFEAQTNQFATGCPLFLYLATRNGFPHDDVVQITREHGQRLFAHLWTAGRVSFEFEEMSAFPDYARNFPPAQDDPDNWVLGSLRQVRFDSLMPSQRPDPNGNPAYTRKGYELIQKLRLNDVEARFATAINGSESLTQIAKKIGIPLNDALLIVFRFTALEIIDFWSSTVLSLPASQTNPAGEGAKKDG
jgi:CheY-like chemotaxis protein